MPIEMPADYGKPIHVYVTYIATTPDKVWAALTEPNLCRQFFFGRSVESDWKVGSPFKLWQEDGTLDVLGEVLVCDAPHRLVVTWHVEWVEEIRHLPHVVVSYQIDDLGGVVRLTMIESHPTPIDEKYYEGGRRGWPIILSGLKSLLETGHALPKFDMGA
jgi:uncharacterized protein YndB with AHSA1/START domain